MNEHEAISKMIAPGTPREGKYRRGVIQIHLTRTCDESCFGCTQGSNLVGKPSFMSEEHFEQAVLSLKGYFGVVGIFGGNPAVHPKFESICEILRRHVPFNQRGLWCNNPINPSKTRAMRETFDPTVSNLNVHLNQKAWNMFLTFWPECRPFGLSQDSRHSPPFVALKDVVESEEERWELISNCDINKHWSAMIGVFRGELRAWFCEIAGAQSILHQDDLDYPDTGIPVVLRGGRIQDQWWRVAMKDFAHQVRKHCHECGVPLRGYGELAQAKAGREQVSQTHEAIFKTRGKRAVELVVVRDQLEEGKITRFTDYVGNARK